MGMLANFHAVDLIITEKIKSLKNDAVIELIEELEDDRNVFSYSMDKLWDGLHYLLTGVSASAPQDGNPLSEAIVGVVTLDIDSFVATIKNDYIGCIVEALKKVDIDDFDDKLDITKLKKAKIYPNIWTEKDKEELLEELKREFLGMLDFYERAQREKKAVVVSIY